MEAKEIYDVNSLATNLLVLDRYYMQLNKTVRIVFNAVKIFQKFLYENTLKICHASHKIEQLL